MHVLRQTDKKSEIKNRLSFQRSTKKLFEELLFFFFDFYFFGIWSIKLPDTLIKLKNKGFGFDRVKK